MGGEAEDVKVKPEAASNVINIVVKDQNSGEVHFKVRSSPHLPRLSELSRLALHRNSTHDIAFARSMRMNALI